MTAAKLSCGITADCTALSWAEHGTLRQTRPAFGGRKLAHIENTCTPVLATVRKGVFKLAFSENAQKWACLSSPAARQSIFGRRPVLLRTRCSAQTLRAQTSSSPEGSAWAAGKTSKATHPCRHARCRSRSFARGCCSRICRICPSGRPDRRFCKAGHLHCLRHIGRCAAS